MNENELFNADRKKAASLTKQSLGDQYELMHLLTTGKKAGWYAVGDYEDKWLGASLAEAIKKLEEWIDLDNAYD